jgi:hypothetical protein
MPWPAHNKDQIKQYPPQHLVPMNYTPKIIHSEPLPSLEPARKRQATPATNIELIARDLNLPAATKQDRAHWAFLKQWAAEDAILEQQRVQQWEWQEEHDKLAEEMARQREERKQQRLQEKLDRDKNKIRGTGLWSRYEVIADEEIERRIAEKNTVVTGTRSGRRFTVAKSDDEDEDLIARAQEALNKDRERELQAQAKAREYREEAKKRDEAKRREVEKQQRRQAILAKVETANAVAGPSRLANGGANCSSIANGANGAHVDARSSRPSPRSSPRKSHPDHDGPSPARVRTPERPPGYDPRPFPKFIVTPSPPIFTARKRGSIPGTATEPIDLTIDDEDDGLDNELAEVERASPIDLTKSDDDFAPRPAPMSLRRITFKTFNVAPPRNLPPPSPTKSTASPIPAKRGPGRPPGSGRKQQLEKKRREREAAKAVADHDPRDPSSSSSSVPSKSDIDSVDEASPRSAEDDIDSQNSMSSGEFDAPVSASSSTAPTSTSLGKRKQPPTDDDSVAVSCGRRPRKAVTQ